MSLKTDWSTVSDSDIADQLDGDTYRRADYTRPDLRKQVADLIADDKGQELVELVRNQLDTLIEVFEKSPSKLSYFILYCCAWHDAVNCAEVYLKGGTGLPSDWSEAEYCPLHTAASSLSLRLTKLLIKFGMRTNHKTAATKTTIGGLLPVHYAVDSIRTRIYWTSEESIFKLILDLTGEGLSKPREVMRLLTNQLSKSEVSEVIHHYASKGKTIELATLLLALSERIIRVNDLYVPHCDVSRQEQIPLRQYVVNQIVSLEEELAKLVVVESAKLAQCRERKESMTSMLLLLEVFLRTGSGIATAISVHCDYPFVPRAIAALFDMLDLKLTGDDASYLDVKFGKLEFSAGREYQHLGDANPIVKRFFPSGMPSLSSLETMEDIGWTKIDSEHLKFFPSSTTLQNLRCHWTPKDSIFKLIIILCLPTMKKVLEAARLLASNLENINEVACTCAREGKLFDLAIMLMVAREKVMDPMLVQINGEKSRRSMTFQQFIKSELAQAIDLECRLLGRTTKKEKGLIKLCKQKKTALISALPLLEIFDKAGADLQEYLQSGTSNVQKEQVIKDVAQVLAKAGFRFNCKDVKMSNVPDSSTEVGTEELGVAVQELEKNRRKSGSVKQDTRKLSYVLPCGFVESHAAFDRANDVNKFLHTRYPRESSASLSAALSFRALWTSNISFSSPRPKALKVPCKDAKRSKQPHVPKFPANRQFSTIALAVIRALKHA